MAKRDGASDGYETISKGETNDCKMPAREWGHFLWASFKAKVARRERCFQSPWARRSARLHVCRVIDASVDRLHIVGLEFELVGTGETPRVRYDARYLMKLDPCCYVQQVRYSRCLDLENECWRNLK